MRLLRACVCQEPRVFWHIGMERQLHVARDTLMAFQVLIPLIHIKTTQI